jgi:hypothetical protein
VLVGSWTLCYVTGYCERLIIVGIIVRWRHRYCVC